MRRAELEACGGVGVGAEAGSAVDKGSWGAEASRGRRAAACGATDIGVVADGGLRGATGDGDGCGRRPAGAAGVGAGAGGGGRRGRRAGGQELEWMGMDGWRHRGWGLDKRQRESRGHEGEKTWWGWGEKVVGWDFGVGCALDSWDELHAGDLMIPRHRSALSIRGRHQLL